MQDGYLGEIRPFAGDFELENWAFCDGRTLPIAGNTDLFNLIGTIYGGDGVTWFALPDLRGRVPVGSGSGPGLSTRNLGEMGGTEEVTLGLAQIPAHSHMLVASNEGLGGNPTGNLPGVAPSDAYGDGAPVGQTPTEPTGGSQPHENIAPSLVLNFMICVNGPVPIRD